MHLLYHSKEDGNMKKIIALLVLVVCMFSLCSCGVAGTIVNVTSNVLINKFYHDYEKPLTTVHVGALSMEIPESFDAFVLDDTAAFVSLNNTWIVVEGVLFMYSSYSAGQTNEEYAALCRDTMITELESVGNIVSDISDIVSIPSGACFSVKVTEGLSSSNTFTSVHSDNDSIWICQFSCVSDRFDIYEPYFIEWASSVKLNSVNSEA